MKRNSILAVLLVLAAIPAFGMQLMQQSMPLYFINQAKVANFL